MMIKIANVKKLLTLELLMGAALMSAQVGINTLTPQKTLHVNGSLQLTKELNVGGDGAAQGNSGISGQVLTSNGPGNAPSWRTLAILTDANASRSASAIPAHSTGTVIARDGQLIVAQEMLIQLGTNYHYTGTATGIGAAIGNLTDRMIDNKNLYSANSDGNYFKVATDGIFMVNMNLQLSTAAGTEPAIGVWDNDAESWVAKESSLFTAPAGKSQAYMLTASFPMLADHTYSFRIINTADVIVKSSDSAAGNRYASQIGLRQLK